MNPFDDDDYRPGMVDCKIALGKDISDFLNRLEDWLKRGWRVRGDVIVDKGLHYLWPMYRFKLEHLLPLDPNHETFNNNYWRTRPKEPSEDEEKSHNERFERIRDITIANNRETRREIENGTWKGFEGSYDVVCAMSFDIGEVEKKVNLALTAEYEPLGNLTLQEGYWFQFMMRYNSGVVA